MLLRVRRRLMSVQVLHPRLHRFESLLILPSSMSTLFHHYPSSALSSQRSHLTIEPSLVCQLLPHWTESQSWPSDESKISSFVTFWSVEIVKHKYMVHCNESNSVCVTAVCFICQLVWPLLRAIGSANVSQFIFKLSVYRSQVMLWIELLRMTYMYVYHLWWCKFGCHCDVWHTLMSAFFTTVATVSFSTAWAQTLKTVCILM